MLGHRADASNWGACCHVKSWHAFWWVTGIGTLNVLARSNVHGAESAVLAASAQRVAKLEEEPLLRCGSLS